MSIFAGPNTITNDSNLILYLDAANKRSYPGTGDVWYDLSGNKNDVLLISGIQYNNYEKSLYGNGSNSYGRTINTLNLLNYNVITITSVWKNDQLTQPTIYEHTSNWNNVNNYEGVNYGGFGIVSNSDGSNYRLNIHHAQLRGNIGYAGVNFRTSNSASYQVYTIIHDFTQGSGEESYAYINGIYITKSSQPSSGSAFNSNNTSFFGNDFLFLWSRGGISAFGTTNLSLLSIYGKRLTDQEIKQNFKAIKSRYNL